MRRIEFLAPIESMRGNLSGSQRLTYPTQNNSAWDSPSDKRNYSTNYNTRYIGNKRAINGKKFFSVKTKTAVTMSPKMRLQQAVLSVGSVMANLIMGDLRTLVALQQLWSISPEFAQGWSFKRWISVYTRNGLKTKRHIVFPTTGSQATIIFVNPYITADAPSQAYSVNEFFPYDLIYKFAPQLGDANLAKFVVEVNGIKYEFFNMVGKTWAENRSTATGVLHGKKLQALFVNGQVINGGISVPSNAESQVNITVDESLTRYDIYTVVEGEEVAVMPSTEVAADDTYVAHV